MRHAGWAIIAGMLTVLVNFRGVGSAQEKQGAELQRSFTGQGYALCGSCTVPGIIGPNLSLADSSERGDHLIITGTVFTEDGLTPDSGITLFLYQADAGGYYHRPKEDVFHPRIFGWLRTGKDGRYEIRTVRPAPEVLEPDGRAHIHVHIFGKGIEEHFLHEFWFAGDEHIPAGDAKPFSGLGSFSPIVTLTRGDDGIWRGTRDIKVRAVRRWDYQKD